jgi:hypothetical protein
MTAGHHFGHHRVAYPPLSVFAADAKRFIFLSIRLLWCFQRQRARWRGGAGKRRAPLVLVAEGVDEAQGAEVVDEAEGGGGRLNERESEEIERGRMSDQREESREERAVKVSTRRRARR